MPTVSRPVGSLRALLEGVVDYAGLFPPANLVMADAVSAFAEYSVSPERWMLGRFVISAAQIDDFAREVAKARLAECQWRVALLAGEDVAGATKIARDVNRYSAQGSGLRVEAVEFKATTPASVEGGRASAPPVRELYAEVPVNSDPTPLVAAALRSGVRLKVRTGGVTAAAFPSAAQLARFVAACVSAGVPFKATAGLHHPLRGSYPLTYGAPSDTAEMFGFLGVFLAPALIRSGLPPSEIETLIAERDPTAFRFEDDAAMWRGWRAGTAEIVRARSVGAVSVGSCSFLDPVNDLTALGLL
ncbi:MAG: hypothetical protein NVS4B3_03150 [Gemmatimonadaceae bacterium]